MWAIAYQLLVFASGRILKRISDNLSELSNEANPFLMAKS
jgi:hypothetical protein